MNPLEISTAVQRSSGPWVEVHLDTLARNIDALRKGVDPNKKIIFVVKSNAYGHGLVPVATKAASCGVDWFAVAYLNEAIALREAVSDARILVLGAVDPACVTELVEYRITPIVVSEQHGLNLAVEAERLGVVLPVHIKIDTGMGRLGILWNEAAEAVNRLCLAPGLDVQGMCSHFATVEPDEPDAATAQFQRFSSVLEATPKKLFTHISSSRAYLYHREWDLDAVRLGIAAYGYGTAEGVTRAHTEPLLHWKTRVIQVKDMPEGSPIGYYGTYITPAPTRIATLAVGYADGYLRTLSNRGHVLIRGKRCRVVGRVSMNWITVDVGAEGDIREGDEAVLLGGDAKRSVWAGELASLCRTIPYEILTGINAQTERKYIG